MRILAIETSCDETAIAIIKCSGQKKRPVILVLANLVSSQVKLHARFGGVVPNLANREHQKNLVPLLLQALKEARVLNLKPKIQKSKLQHKIQEEFEHILDREPELLLQFKKKIVPMHEPDIDAIAVTNGPGLAPALWVGVNFARALALLWKKPLIPVNHMEGHLYSSLIQSYETRSRKIGFPALALLVSGGHTELVLAKNFGKYKIIGETVDDAAGEAFDKVARMLGLGYPGGPAIAREAERRNFQFPISNFQKNSKSKAPNVGYQIHLPRPMINSKDYNFSFSGLKTAVLYLIRDINDAKKVKKLRPAIAKEFQDAVVDVLVAKTIRAAGEYNVKTVLLGGGVAANVSLQENLKAAVKKDLPNSKFYIPDSNVTGDNALMIALVAYLAGKKKAPNKVGAEANLRL